MTGELVITLKSDLCAGSGEAAGVSVDTDICTDEYGLPYLPARRLKGILRKAAETLLRYDCPGVSQDGIDKLFGVILSEKMGEEQAEKLLGKSVDLSGCLRLQDARLPGTDAMRVWLSGDDVPQALRRQEERPYIPPLYVTKLFTAVRGQTRMEHGIADNQSLRYTRVLERRNALNRKEATVFHAPAALDVDHMEPEDREALTELFQKSCQAARRVGTMQNRGLGLVAISWKKAPLENAHKFLWPEEKPDAKKIEIVYTLSLDAPVTLPGCGERSLEIPARSVIGCVSGAYQRREDRNDAEFRNLFLSGNVQWSSLTPAIQEQVSVFQQETSSIPERISNTVRARRSIPTPLMLVHMKNEGCYRNLLVSSRKEAEGKQKTLAGTYAVLAERTRNPDSQSCNTDSESYLLEVHSHAVYHHSHDGEGTLYLQESLDSGMIYGGTVTLPYETQQDKDTAKRLFTLLKETRFSFGRSRGAQYAACSLQSLDVRPCVEQTRATKEGDPVYVVLASDLILEKDGLFCAEPEAVREALSKALGVKNEHPPAYQKDAREKGAYQKDAGRGAEREAEQRQIDYCQYHTISGYQQLWQMQKTQITVLRGGSVFGFVSNGGEIPDKITIGCFRQEGFGVCHIYTKADMEQLRNIVKKPVARPPLPERSEETDWTQKLQSALVVEAGRSAVRECVRAYYQANKDTLRWSRSGIVGRLRLMLSEAAEYPELIARIQSIRESDNHAENQISDQERALQWVQGLCGTGEFSLSALLSGYEQENAGLRELILQDEDARRELVSHWKEPLRLLFRLAYYDEGGNA